MSDYFFGSGSGRPSQRIERRVNAIAKRHGAKLHCHNDVARNVERYFFITENRGAPFDRQTEQAITSAIKSELGLDISNLGKRSTR